MYFIHFFWKLSRCGQWSLLYLVYFWQVPHNTKKIYLIFKFLWNKCNSNLCAVFCDVLLIFSFPISLPDCSIVPQLRWCSFPQNGLSCFPFCVAPVFDNLWRTTKLCVRAVLWAIGAIHVATVNSPTAVVKKNLWGNNMSRNWLSLGTVFIG